MVKEKSTLKIILSILITLAVILTIAFYEHYRLNKTFSLFSENLSAFYDKVERQTATYDDGVAIKEFWENQKNTLHIWIPHTDILEIDYQLYEAVGYLYVRDYKSALPKIEILLGICENIPQSYRWTLENVF